MLPRIHPTSNTSTNTRQSLTTLRQDRTHALIRAVGEWDLANAHMLEEVLQEHEEAGRWFVRLDLSAVSFLDCTCLGCSSPPTSGCWPRDAHSCSPASRRV